MKKRTFFCKILILFCIFVTQLAQAQNLPSVDSIIARHAQAMGGKTAWKQLKSFRMVLQDHNHAQNLTFQMTMLMKRPKCFQIIFELPQTKLIKSYDGKMGWISNNGKLEKMREGEVAEMAEESEFYEEFLLSKERGYTTELLGQDTARNGIVCYKVRMKKSADNQHDYYINPKTYLLEQVSEFSEDAAFAGELFTTTFADFKTTPNGLVFPYQQQLFSNNTLILTSTIQTLELNVQLGTRLFQQPNR